MADASFRLDNLATHASDISDRREASLRIPMVDCGDRLLGEITESYGAPDPTSLDQPPVCSSNG